MEGLYINPDIVFDFLTLDKLSGAVLKRFLLIQVSGEAIISYRRKKEWADDIGVSATTINRKLRYLEKVHVLYKIGPKKYGLADIALVEPEQIKPKYTGFWSNWAKLFRKKKSQNKLTFEN